VCGEVVVMSPSTSSLLTQPFSLLIADDDRAARETLRDVFEPAGYRTLLARDGAEAVELVRSHHDIHLALMDVHMPRLTGLEALELLHQIHAGLPAILLSADRDEKLMRQALSAHAFCVLAKPVNKNVLIYVVSRALRKFYADDADAPLA
jgi:CheY-like chemotaxis protein